MTGSHVQLHVTDRKLKSVESVFDAIVNSEKLTKFFASDASGPLIQGQSVTWTFADVGARISPEIKKIDKDRHITFDWSASGQTARVDIDLEPHGDQSTRVTIVETGWPKDAEGVKRVLGQTQGWTDFICCMKAYLQHSVQLRRGRVKDAH